MIIERKKIKSLIAICLVLVLNITSFAAIVSDNDGATFVTKGEFDNLKNDFAKQVNDYNKSIDGKIDGAIAEYLAGMSTTPIEVKKVLYPCDHDESIWCMKKDIAEDKINFSYAYPKYEYLAENGIVSSNGSNYYDVNYMTAKYTYAGSAGEKRIILTSSDNFSSDFVWDRYVENVTTSIKCFAWVNSLDMGPWLSAFTATAFDAIPNLVDGSKYYDDLNAIPNFIKYRLFLQYGKDRSYQTHDNIMNPTMYSNVVELSKGVHTKGTTYKNAIVYDTGTKRYVCMDEPRWVNTVCALSSVKTQDAFSKLLTRAFSVSLSENYTTKRGWFTPNYSQETFGQMPIFGMYDKEKDMAEVKNKNNVINYNGGRGILTDIKLINGIPLLYGEQDRLIEWTPIMEDTSEDYNFYLSMTKFTGVPDPSTCLDVSVDGATATKTPVLKSGQKLSFTMPSDGVVWLKWSDSTGTGGGALEIGKCSEFKSIDQS